MKGTRIAVILIAVLALAVTVFTSCATKPAAPGGQAQPVQEKKPIKLRYSGGLAPTHPNSQQQKWWAEEVQKRSNGLITVEIYQGAQLYDHSQVIDAVTGGAIEMGYTMLGRWSERNPLYGFYNYFMLLSGEHFERAGDRLKTVMWPVMERDGVKNLHWMSFGDFVLASNKKVVLPGDMKGLAIRAGAKETLSVLKVLGSVPAQIASGEEYDALAKGTLDGTFSGWSNIVTRKMYEVTKFYTGSLYPAPVIAQMNAELWKSLHPDYQKLIMEVSLEVEKMSYRRAIEFDRQSIELLKTKGTVIELTDAQRAEWVKVLRGAWEDWVKSVEAKGMGKEAREIIKIAEETL